ncbi:uncharacterized protein [Dermacentor andersoni]|uniref:uncharacterized protein n=1 Tax=Dermacentor andersoni TaxID=34620 RepID=UPI003B3B0D7B
MQQAYYFAFQILMWFIWPQCQCKAALGDRRSSDEFQPWTVSASDDKPGWGCPNHSMICHLFCSNNGSLFGYCNKHPENGGCHCVDNAELRGGILTKRFLKQASLQRTVLGGVKCTPGISGCDVQCLKYNGLFTLCGGKTPDICNCYYYKGTAVTGVQNSSIQKTNISEHLRHWKCPERRGPCDFYCLISGSPLGYCELGNQKCHCVNPEIIGKETGVRYYRDAGRIVKAYQTSYGCPAIQECAIRCLIDGGLFSVCNMNPPYHCFCYFMPKSRGLPNFPRD